MSIAVLVVTDGRLDHLAESVRSLHSHFTGSVTERWMFDDSGVDTHRAELRRLFPEFRHINGGPRQGFGGAIREAWAVLGEHSMARYIAHCEDDFTYNHPVDLNGMVQVLQAHPYLVQLCLRRQPWNEHERLAGGIVEQHPDAYEEHRLGKYAWLEHRMFFSTNPSLYRRTLCLGTDWPEGSDSEGHYTHHLLRHGTPEADGEQVRFAFWGDLASGEAVTHIGHERVGSGY